ncbi:MAG TPA: hypothetical protein VHU83_03210 [Bryobacteraceae bacterium]|nr:hypothetical protein [Bryobacteraceae bacterium]
MKKNALGADVISGGRLTFSSIASVVGTKAFASKVAKSNRCPSTNTLFERSPAPPEIGWL